jgi:Bacterial Ig-like domain (group 1)/Bacterial pre-peptidase C-terminal domain
MRTVRRMAALAALLALAGACDEDNGGTGPVQPAAVVAATPTTQEGTVGANVATAPAVRVTDARGRGVAGVPVTFAVTSGGGAVGTASAATDASGVASAGSWQLGTRGGEQVVTATVAGLEAVSFTATARAGAAAALARSGGDAQTGTVGTALADSLAVRATDRHGNPVAGVTVSFTVASGEASLSAASAVTSADGYARTRLTLGRQAGTVAVAAAAAGAPPVTFTARAVAGPAVLLAAHAGNEQSVMAGEAVPVAPAARATDAFGNPVAGVPVSFSVLAGNGSVSGSTAATDSSGVAAVGGWTLGAAGENTLRASAGTLAPVTFVATALDPCATSAAYTFGGTATGELTARDCRLGNGRAIDFYSFSLAEARSFVVELNGSPNPFAYLFDAAGRVVAVDDDGGPGQNARIHVLAGAGSYFVGASTSAGATEGPVLAAAYSLSTRAEPLDVAGCVQPFLLPGASVAQQLTAGDDCYPFRIADRYHVYLRAGDTVTIREASTAFDAYLRLYDPSGFTVASNDDADGSLNSRITFTASSAGRYTIEATSLSSFGTGAYTLSIQ